MDVHFFWRGVSLMLVGARPWTLRGPSPMHVAQPGSFFFWTSLSGDSLYTCEQKLIGAGLEDKLPLFRVFFKILSEFQMGENSPWYSWLNSLPRIYNTGGKSLRF